MHDHIILPDTFGVSIEFAPNGSGSRKYPVRDQAAHARHLRQLFNSVWMESERTRRERQAVHLPDREGTYIEYKGEPGYSLNVDGLENQKRGIRIADFRSEVMEGGLVEYTTVFVPAGQESFFMNKLSGYENDLTEKGNPRYESLFRTISDVRSALVDSLWVEDEPLPDTDDLRWYEVWIHLSHDNHADAVDNQCQRFRELLTRLQVESRPNILIFPERAVFLVRTNKSGLAELLSSTSQLSEFRRASEPVGYWLEIPTPEQGEWVEDLLNRLVLNQENEVSVCILDEGVTHNHPLLQPFYATPAQRCLSIDPNWGTIDRGSIGHGTLMSGVTAYGDLTERLMSSLPFTISHKLCSVKLLPNPPAANPQQLWGQYTERAIYTAEISLPEEKMIFCMPVTGFASPAGRPTSWSGAVDQLAYNDGIQSRLIILSAGNIDNPVCQNFHLQNTLYPIREPAQAWNALTVGAYTEKTALNSTDPRLAGKHRVAEAGELSPYSTTSVLWQSNPHSPIKPEIVMEGGNMYETGDPAYPYSAHPDLESLSLNNRYQMTGGLFDTIAMTSGAAAFAANLAARIKVRYPGLSAESIRGVIVHSARWTEAMIRDYPDGNRTEMEYRLRNCGYGVPDARRALSSFNSGFTFITEGEITPFVKKDSSVSYNDMVLYRLPWPADLLREMGDMKAKLKVTLSYFVEPSPGEMGWNNKYRYPSCGLRFDVNLPTENERDFLTRINRKVAESDNPGVKHNSDSGRWLLGNLHRRGSIHVDEITATASEIAECRYVAVFPSSGWWRTRQHLRKYDNSIRYSLLISLEVPETEADLYTVVQSQIASRVAVEVNG